MARDSLLGSKACHPWDDGANDPGDGKSLGEGTASPNGWCPTRLFEQIGVRSGSHKDNQPMLGAVIKLVCKQKVAANMTLPMTDPIAA